MRERCAKSTQGLLSCTLKIDLAFVGDRYYCLFMANGITVGTWVRRDGYTRNDIFLVTWVSADGRTAKVSLPGKPCEFVPVLWLTPVYS